MNLTFGSFTVTFNYLQICTELGLCSADVEEIEPTIVEDSFEVISSEEDEEDVNDRPYCMMCEYVVGEIDKYITDNRTEESIQETVEQICHILRYLLLYFDTKM